MEVSTAKYQRPDLKLEPVTRPLVHYSAAEAACGTAIFVDDLRTSVDELQMVLLQGRRAKAKIRGAIHQSQCLTINSFFLSFFMANIVAEEFVCIL
jgi:xanthine dehydrogenase molybdopterin-binding subunit B